ncbi:MAG: hypothetical protein AB1485_06505 [Candidatus Thermoplasmatota archaeon]
MIFEDDTPIGKIKIKGPRGDKEVICTVDTGAFKSLISTNVCSELGLNVKEIKEIRGVCKKPVNVKIYWAEVFFDNRKCAESIICFDLPVGKNAKDYEKALIGRDILNNLRVHLDFKKRQINYSWC